MPKVIDPRLTERFAVIRDGRSSPGAIPTASDIEAIGRVSLAPVAQRYGLDPSAAIKALVGSSIDVLIVPGQRGVFLIMYDGSGGFFGFGATIAAVLRGDPIGTSGSALFGMAPDGVCDQPITLSDGSTIQASVMRNLYTVTDPFRVHCQLASGRRANLADARRLSYSTASLKRGRPSSGIGSHAAA